MGVFRNAVKRKTHKERAQPLARRKYGLLEKKKDYRLRSRDFHKKEDHLKLLRRKAEEKNPDEFYFGMEKAITKDGIHIKPTGEPNKYTQEELLLMKTQDIKYIALKAQTEAKKMERLQQRLHLIDGPVQSQHTIFVSKNEESSDDSDIDNTTKEHGGELKLLKEIPKSERDGSQANLLKEDPKIENSSGISADLDTKLHRHKAAAYKQLIERTNRHNKLLQMAQDMAFQKELMGKGGNKKFEPQEPGGKPVYKWNLVRKR